MAFKGFGKQSGPGASPRAETPFAYFPRPPSPNPPPSLHSYPREPETQGRIRSPPLPFESIHSVVGPSNAFAAVQRPVESTPKWGNGQNSIISDSNAQIHQRPSVVPPFVNFRNSGPGFPDRSMQIQDMKRTRMPPFLSSDEDHVRNSRTVIVRHSVSQRAQSPPSSFQNGRHLDDLGAFSDVQRPALPSHVWPNQSKLSTNFAHSLTQQDLPSVSANIGTYDSTRNFPTNHEEVIMPKRTRSPPPSYEDSIFAGNNSKRPSFSPPRSSTRPNPRFDIADTRNNRWSPPSARVIDAESTPTKPTNLAVQKRTRSPSLPSSDQAFEGNSSAQGEIERELQAKAKRLARFKEELSQPEPSGLGIGNQKVPVNRQDRPTVEMRSEQFDMAGDFRNGNLSSDYETQESSSIIIGLCPDMCPETERGERERKGDLDQYERLGGDRNQTNKSLAVKKYTRTAEREADLIRPMPILQKTLDYLLNLLDQPYDERFLGLYNFLWDRMRAIRMDLRMQHIFNQGAITMLEQMIRLHIIAMHELCEYTKGEGFSEGFDAHLNIEQMNKTSVELFQLYDDHRKKGIDVPTEKEFRGYYALLKLDKHPGYKVEPAELSLDLAKMTPEIRQTPEVVFARDVARACRTGNFIAFFRLARKASYLQACLMHAHFAKLRSQALAALHSGLQNNQGIPITHVAKWLGMEDEDIENLMEYHGFLIKEFDEPYMVKEGPFLSGDNDYPLKCSKLVHQKKSRRIVEDVSSPSLMEKFSSEKVKVLKPRMVYEKEPTLVQFGETKKSPLAIDHKMPVFEAISSPKNIMQVKPLIKSPVVDQWRGDHNRVAAVSPLPMSFSLAHSSVELVEAKNKSAEKPKFDIFTRNSLERNISFDMKSTPVQISPKRVHQQTLPPLQMNFSVENPVHQSLFDKGSEKEESTGFHEETETETETETDEINANYYDEEVAEAKLKLILRIWRRRCSRRREIRERKQLAANAALSKLSMGTPIWNDKDPPITPGEFNIDQVMSERYDEHERSSSRLNVSDVIAAKLSERNPNARCLCWKLLLCSQMENQERDKPEQNRQVSHLAAGSWLCSKLMPATVRNEDDLVISSPGLSIWKKWVPNQSDDDTCCLSVIKDTNPNNPNDSVLGASAVVFVVYKCIPWELQKTHLHRLLMSLPYGSHLPLLILSGSQTDGSDSDPSTIAKELELHEVDKSRMSKYSIVSLIENQQTKPLDHFFSDERLREGLQWLARESPLQPDLHCIKPRDLVRAHLNPSLEVLDEYNGYEVSPNHCISALNEALGRSIEDINTSANSNPTHWPCPEINLLHESSYEHKAVDWYLPSIGWSLPTRLESLTHAISHCKVPTFPDDLSWLFRGSDLGMDTEIQRLKLEDCLVKYLAETSRLMGLSLARKEANTMLQKCARLELRGSTYYIVPRWAMIFRRIFNWRLSNLSADASSEVYILENRNGSNSRKLGFEGGVSSLCYLVPPSLDEMVEVGRSPFKHNLEFEAYRPLSSEQKEDEMYLVEDDGDLGETNNNCTSNDGLENRKNELVVVDSGRKEADRLSKLLEQCNIVQNLNAEKLSIYF